MERINANNDAQNKPGFPDRCIHILMALLFVFTFIPQMFVPFQSNSDELTMAADNAAMTLVENVLIDNRHVDSRSGSIDSKSGADTPGIIDRQKYLDLKNIIIAGSPGYSQR